MNVVYTSIAQPRGFLSSAQVLVEDKSAAIIVGGNMDFDPTEVDARPDAWLFWPHNSSFSQLPDLPIKSQGMVTLVPILPCLVKAKQVSSARPGEIPFYNKIGLL